MHSEVNEEPVHDIDQALSEQHDASSQCASDDEGAACSQHENGEEIAKPDKHVSRTCSISDELVY